MLKLMGKKIFTILRLIFFLSTCICYKYQILMCWSIWALTPENLSLEISEQQRRRPACALAQTDQLFIIPLLESIIS